MNRTLAILAAVLLVGCASEPKTTPSESAVEAKNGIDRIDTSRKTADQYLENAEKRLKQ